MVEIKPYVEEDEGDDENWVPLFPSTSMQSTEQSDSAAAAHNITLDGSGVDGAVKGGFPSVDSEDDDDEGWQKLCSSRDITAHQSQAAPSVSSLMEFIPALSVITKVTTVPPASDENDDVLSESEENIKWGRPDELDDTEIKHFRDDRDVGGVFEDYNDDKISSMRLCENEVVEHIRQRPIVNKSQLVAKEDYTSISSSDEESLRKQQEREQKQQQQLILRPQQQQQEQPPSNHIKSKLQEKFIHDPLRSLPLRFLRNFFLEAKYQLTFAWRCYFINENDENGSNGTSMDTGVLAALLLYSIIGLFALGLILHGIYDIGLVMLSTLIWSMETSTAETSLTSSDGMCASICTTLILGTVIWLVSKLKSRECFEATLILSNAVPVIVALTSPSVFEFFVIGLSIRTFLSVCMTGLIDAGCPPGMSTVAVVVIVTAVSVFLVMNLVSWQKLEEGENNDLAEMKPPSYRKTLIGESFCRVMTYPHECHALGIVTLAAMSIALILLRDGIFIFSSLRMLRICLSIGVGIFVLERLWDSILDAVAVKSDRRAAMGLSWRHVSRRAMRKSLLDLSKSALWSKDDTGNVILGILSEEDSELRYAILEWILNRWTATSYDQSAEGLGGTAYDQSEEENSVPNEANEEKKTGTSDSAEVPHPPSRSENSQQAPSDDTKFEANYSNSDSCSEAEFNENCESDFRTNEHRQPSTASYQSLQSVITRLDADEALIPTIERYREWVYSLKPNSNLALCVAVWKLCPAMTIFGAAFIWYFGRSFLQVVVFYTLGSTSRGSVGNLQCLCVIAGALWPLLLTEYYLLSRWWETHFKGCEDIPDSVMILLESEIFSPKLLFYPTALITDTSALFLRVWNLLLESITLLESSVPAVRCATVAACTADLAADTLCLVDLAFEVQKRGVFGGIGMLILDAFTHHLKEELRQRRSTEGGDTNQDEELDSKYTGAVINSTRNIGKISQNIGGLMNSKKKQDGMKEKDKEGAMKSDNNGESGRVAEQDSLDIPYCSVKNADEIPEVFNQNRGSDSTQGDEVATNEGASFRGQSGSTRLDTKQTSQEAESEANIEQKDGDDGGNLIPIVIGGGLAVLGAFIGGVTVAAANNKNDDKRRSRDSDSS